MEMIESDRMLFFGCQALAEGFALIGFETWGNATVDDLDRELEMLLDTRANAFILIEDKLAVAGSSRLSQVKTESGRILIAEIPTLATPQNFMVDADERVRLLLGGQSFDDESEDRQ
jgi:vacuolar-type H+-ATPase subunit F/Vma7